MENTRADSAASSPRLRVPDRGQVVMKVEAPDDLIPAGHRARVVWRVVESMDLSAFLDPIKARDGVCGPRRHRPAAAGRAVALRHRPRRRLGAGAGAAVPGVQA